jgi:hypothetical protein
MVAHICNSSYLGCWDHSLKPAWTKQFARSHLQNNQSKMDWRHSSSSSVPALQVLRRWVQTPVPPKIITKAKKIIIIIKYCGSVREHLTGEHEVLRSNPSTTKEKVNIPDKFYNSSQVNYNSVLTNFCFQSWFWQRLWFTVA